MPVIYFPFVEGFTDLKNDFALLEAKLNRMKQADVLFIDDLFKPVNGKPRATDWQLEQMYSVLNYRYLNHKPILLSSELTIEALVRVDEALGTRIYEMCSDYLVIIKGALTSLTIDWRASDNVQALSNKESHCGTYRYWSRFSSMSELPIRH